MVTQGKMLDGQVAVITGGGRGIGRAIAKTLAGAGAHAVVAARSADELDQTVREIESTGGRALAIPLDVTDQGRVEQMVARVEAELGPITILVNNAGVVCEPGPIRDADPAEWWRVMDINLRGPLLCSQAVLKGMSRRKRGRIIHVSSGAGNFPWQNVSAYAISKAALTRFAEILALETADDNIAVFSLSPGVVRTAMTEKASSEEWRKWDSMVFNALAEGEDAPPEDAARLTLDLVSGRFDILSGRLIRITDDLHEMAAQAERIKEEELYVLRLRRL